jgi:chromosomal replication initiator protein
MREDELKGILNSHKLLVNRMEKMLKALPKKVPGKRFPVDRIIDEVNKEFNVDLTTQTRERKIMNARHAATYLLKNHTNMVWREIAYSVGNTHHTTVIHSFRACNDLIETDDEYSTKINNIKNRLIDLES